MISSLASLGEDETQPPFSVTTWTMPSEDKPMLQHRPLVCFGAADYSDLWNVHSLHATSLVKCGFDTSAIAARPQGARFARNVFVTRNGTAVTALTQWPARLVLISPHHRIDHCHTTVTSQTNQCH
ncbi:MAG: hypothetical protein WCO60_00700 [Verrucomicrobiota bacterium]